MEYTMSPDILAATFITRRPSQLIAKLRNKSKKTSDVKQTPMTDGVGTLVVLALSLCLSVPRRIQTSCVSQRQMPMATPWNPACRSNQWWIGPTVRFICHVILMTTDTCLIWGTVRRLHPADLVLALVCQQQQGACKRNSPYKTARGM